ncbi:family 78 glycoside hydrolase catalytic domain [Luteibacter flocculans]|uniref:alpha-L-rhamnosidase n=1 Tax=Luteibacter flocculans TaxID=2780091 RepID=A0ABY4T3G6_9GAMM|nr:alpha-L-rhamnosidase [Luteibacter flocculans]URL58804.1 family 78 glycoside hydrolase catalytic domain [Luteibacter flocculans]
MRVMPAFLRAMLGYLARTEVVTLLLRLFAACAWLAVVPVANAAITLATPRVERAESPTYVDVKQPRFSWVVRSDAPGTVQIGYRLVVSRNGSTVWDSGEVNDPRPFDIAYAGAPLSPGERYDWRVDVRTSDGSAEVSSHFDTALDEAAWHDVRWIGKRDDTLPAPLLRKTFRIDGPVKRATLYVAAGGYADMAIDGRPVSDAVLSPGFTDYDKRVEVVATDVSLSPGTHVLGAELGRGFYGLTNPNVWHWERAPWHGKPRLRALLRIRYADGRVSDMVSDASWQVADGPTRLDDLYGGEIYDARFVRPDAWAPASELPAPRGKLVAQTEQPVRVIDTLAATEVTEPVPGTYVFAFPRVIAGWATFDVSGPSGTTVVARYGEKLLADGTVDARDEHHYFKNGFQTDRMILAGERIRWHPRFSYKGFRYVQVDGWPGGKPRLDAVTAQVVHTDIAITGQFDSDQPLLNWIHHATVDTILNNLHSIPTDTPMYEKNGWTGDGMLGTEMFLRNLDADRLLAKWLRDIADTRGTDGAPLLIAPNPGWGHVRAPTWHAAYVFIPWWLWLYEGDRRPMEEHIEGIARYVAMEDARSPAGIADTELGDWVSPETDPAGENAPEDKRVAATAYLYGMQRRTADMLRVLGDDARATTFDARAEVVKKAFNARFLDRSQARYRGEGDRGYRQAHNLLALSFGLVPDDLITRVAAGVAADARGRGDHLDTGALATKVLLPFLTATGHADEAWAIATQTTFPSWGFWRANGATSLWEHWKLASRSRGHYFLGTIDDWLYADVAGLRPLAPGWQRFEVRPKLTAFLGRASASVVTPYGEASVAWRKVAGRIEADVVVPVGAEAVVGLPGGPDTVMGSGRHHLSLH